MGNLKICSDFRTTNYFITCCHNFIMTDCEWLFIVYIYNYYFYLLLAYTSNKKRKKRNLTKKRFIQIYIMNCHMLGGFLQNGWSLFCIVGPKEYSEDYNERPKQVLLTYLFIAAFNVKLELNLGARLSIFYYFLLFIIFIL